MRTKRKIILLILIATALTARIIPGPRTIDDAFITFRYASNILAGNGFVFNSGERIQGTTTPLYSMMMAFTGLFWWKNEIPFPQISLFINAMADGISCVLIFLIGEKLGKTVGGLAAGFAWAIAPFSVSFAIGGLETSLYILLLTGTIWFYLNKKRKTTALFAILSCLARPDAILLIGPLILARLFSSKVTEDKIRFNEILVFIIPGLLWGIFALKYFGNVIPHSVVAKMEVYKLDRFSAFIRLLQHYAVLFMQNKIIGTVPAVASGIVLIPFFYMIGAANAYKTDRSILPYAIYPWLYLIVFSIPNPLIFRWYLAPPTLPLILFVLMGAEDLLKEISHKLRRSNFSKSFQRIGSILILILPIGFYLSNWTLHPDHGTDRPAPEMAWNQLEILYQQAADKISPLVSSHTVLAAGDVGVLGYYTPCRILDTVGLNSPQSLKYYPLSSSDYVINYAIPTALINQESPDWIIVLEVYGRNTFLRNEQFLNRYMIWDQIPTDIYGSNGLLIIKKKG